EEKIAERNDLLNSNLAARHSKPPKKTSSNTFIQDQTTLSQIYERAVISGVIHLKERPVFSSVK
ncbi:MAG: hypothetical protein QMC11_11670, partial [Rhodospirillales bacterium]